MPSKILKNARIKQNVLPEEATEKMFDHAINNKKEFAEQVLSMLTNNNTIEEIKLQAERAYSSGAIDISELTKENFSTAKATLSVIFQNLTWQFAPLTKEGREIVKNLSKFI